MSKILRTALSALSIVALLLYCSVAQAERAPSKRKLNSVCATKHFSKSAHKRFQKGLQKIRAQRLAAPAALAEGVALELPVYFHIIQKDSFAGAVSDARIQHQLDVMNAAYAGTQGGATSPYKFVLKGVDRTINPTWYTMKPDSAIELEAKRSLRKGGAGDLNIYVISPSLTLGWASPYWYLYYLYPTVGPSADDLIRDGVVVANITLPFTWSSGAFNQGDTAVHEVGHWLGLFHTYENGCSTKGDYVADTPSELWPSLFCNMQRDTCPANAGFDPVTNFMDYTDDKCRTGFSAGQVERMQMMFDYYRKNGWLLF